MTIVRNSTPILKANGAPATGNKVRVYRRDTGALITEVKTSGTLGASAGVNWVSTSTSSGWANYTMRLIVSSSILIPGDQIRISLTAGTGTSAMMSSAYVGQAAASGDIYDFMGTPTQILFGGLSNITVPVNQTRVSDWVNYTYDRSTNLVVSIYFSGTTDLGSTPFPAGWQSRYDTGNSSSTINVSGYTTAGAVYGVTAIEIRDSTLVNGYYIAPCGTFSGEVDVVCLDTTNTQNDLIQRAIPI